MYKTHVFGGNLSLFLNNFESQCFKALFMNALFGYKKMVDKS